MSRKWTWSWEMERPTVDVRDAVNELLDRNGRTRGAHVGEMYLGKRGLFVELRRTRVIEGTCSDVDATVDLFDLMDMHAAESRGQE